MVSQSKRRELEKFYTKPHIVKKCMKAVATVIKRLKLEPPFHIIEPSAGSGSFIEQFDSIPNCTYDAYDILPEHVEVVKKDFLKMPLDKIVSQPQSKYKNLLIIGNPPYKMAIKFINKCAELNPALICFVLPNVFKKPTMINKLHKNYHFYARLDLPRHAFELGDEAYDVPSSFFIFRWRDKLRRPIKLDIECKGYSYVPFKSLTIKDGVITGADISVVRVGGRAGTAFLAGDTSDNAAVSKQKYNYFIKLVKLVNIKKVVARINAVKWDANNTTGPRSVGKYELTPVLNTAIN